MTSASKPPPFFPTPPFQNGAAVIHACEQLNERLKPYKWEFPEASWEEWVDRAFADRVNLAATGIFDASKVDYDFASNKGTITDYYTYGVGCVQVELHCQGRLRMEQKSEP